MYSFTLSCVIACCCIAIATATQCTTMANSNITMPDIAPKQFHLKVEDCCAACDAINGCAAAVYVSYFCYFKSSSASVVAADGYQVVVITPTTPVPPTTTTTAAPTPMPTPVPTEPTYITIIREVSCQYSSHCNQTNDYTCTTAVYFNNTCDKKHNRVCGTYYITVDKYEDEGCRGVTTSHDEEDMNRCDAHPENDYLGHYCDVQRSPASGIPVLRTACSEGCDGQNCDKDKFTTGVCRSNPFGSLSGSSVIAWCFPEYVVYSAYGSIDCSGPIENSRAEPLGCQGSPYTSIQNICG